MHSTATLGGRTLICWLRYKNLMRIIRHQCDRNEWNIFVDFKLYLIPSAPSSWHLGKWNMLVRFVGSWWGRWSKDNGTLNCNCLIFHFTLHLNIILINLPLLHLSILISYLALWIPTEHRISVINSSHIRIRLSIFPSHINLLFTSFSIQQSFHCTCSTHMWACDVEHYGTIQRIVYFIKWNWVHPATTSLASIGNAPNIICFNGHSRLLLSCCFFTIAMISSEQCM